MQSYITLNYLTRISLAVHFSRSFSKNVLNSKLLVNIVLSLGMILFCGADIVNIDNSMCNYNCFSHSIFSQVFIICCCQNKQYCCRIMNSCGIMSSAAQIYNCNEITGKIANYSSFFRYKGRPDVALSINLLCFIEHMQISSLKWFCDCGFKLRSVLILSFWKQLLFPT